MSRDIKSSHFISLNVEIFYVHLIIYRLSFENSACGLKT